MNLFNIFSAPIIEFKTIDSTNKYAKELCKTNPENGTIIIADEQTKGRGRFGNTWESHKNKGLYYSIIFKKLPNLNYETLTLFICLGITKLLEDYSIESKIKWPNDILINGEKVCGILSEVTQSPNEDYIIIGIGINLYHDKEDFPQELKYKATSLKLHTPNNILKTYFVNSLTNYIFDYYNYFLSNSFESILTEYKNKSFLINKEITLNLNGKQVTGIVEDFNTLGHLILNTENEKIEINSGEISLENIYKKAD